MVEASEYDAIVCDLLLPDGHGTKILEKLKEKRITTPFVMMTKVTDAPLAVNAMKMGAADYLIKPVHDIQLVDAVMKAIRNSPPKHKGHIIYERQSPAYQKMMRRVRIFASTDSTVLIYGVGIISNYLELFQFERTAGFHAGDIQCKLVCLAVGIQ